MKPDADPPPAMRAVRVSGAGLVACPSCGSHTRVAAQVERTRCAFCGKSIMTLPWRGPARGPGRLDAVKLLGRSHVIAVALAQAAAGNGQGGGGEGSSGDG